jgi:hypothetical protein
MASLISILDVDSDGARGVIAPCGIINKGINTAARVAGAAFAVQFTLVYPSGGEHVTLAPTVNIANTKEIGNFDSQSVSFEVSINLGGKNVDPNTHVMLNAQIIHRTPTGDQAVGDSFVGSFHV